jgi:hypothetical protein
MWADFNLMAHLPTWNVLFNDLKEVIERNAAKYVRQQREEQANLKGSTRRSELLAVGARMRRHAERFRSFAIAAELNDHVVVPAVGLDHGLKRKLPLSLTPSSAGYLVSAVPFSRWGGMSSTWATAATVEPAKFGCKRRNA